MVKCRQLTVYLIRLTVIPMGDVTPLRRRHRKPQAGRRRKRDDDMLYLFIVGGFALLAIYSVVNQDKLPAAVQTVVKTSRGQDRDRSPTAGAYYPNCDAARAAGVTPLYADEPGYREAMDGDEDGVACEPYRRF